MKARNQYSTNRNALRNAIVSHTHWDNYQRTHNCDIQKMTCAELEQCADTIGVDADSFATGGKPRQRIATMQNTPSVLPHRQQQQTQATQTPDLTSVSDDTDTEEKETMTQTDTDTDTSDTEKSATDIAMSVMNGDETILSLASRLIAAEDEAKKAAKKIASAETKASKAIMGAAQVASGGTATETNELTSVSEGVQPPTFLGYEDAGKVFKKTSLKGIKVGMWSSAGHFVPAIDPMFDFDTQNLKDTLRDFLCGENPSAVGKPGTGKSTFFEQIAARTGRPFFVFTYSDLSDPMDSLGSKGLKAGDTKFEVGALVKAWLTPGAIVMHDEWSNANPNLLTKVLNEVLSVGYMTLDDGSVCHRLTSVNDAFPDNTGGIGLNAESHAGCTEQNSALIDRMGSKLEFDYLAPSREAKIIHKRTSVDQDLLTKLCEFAKVTREGTRDEVRELSTGLSHRQLNRWAKHISVGATVEESFFSQCVRGNHEQNQHCLKELARMELNFPELENMAKGIAPTQPSVTDPAATAQGRQAQAEFDDGVQA